MVIVPLTTRDRRIPLHVRIGVPEGGVRVTSFAMCEMVRSVSTDRLIGDDAWGTVSPDTMKQVDDRLRILFDL